MKQLFTNANILSHHLYRTLNQLLVEDGVITAVGEVLEAPADAEVIDLAGDHLIPGFIDVQVNGGGGVLFNDDISVDGIRAIGAAHRAFGTTGFLPTLISDDLDKVAAAIKAVDDAIEMGVPGVLGIHIEGPFLNTAKKGIHDASKFKTLDDDAVALLSSLKNGVTVVTIAPECTTPEMISKLVCTGVKVCAGHTNATYGETRTALDAGLDGFTHLYNAMTPLASREPGVVGAALSDANSFAGIIVDGFHVHPAAVKAAVDAIGDDHMMLVTDAVSSVGATDKNFTLFGVPITVEGGKCTGPDGTLAGSDLDMISAVKNTADWGIAHFRDAVKMASLTPATYLGLDHTHGSIAIGKAADMIRLDNNRNIVTTWIGGNANT